MDPEIIQQGIQAAGGGFHILVETFVVDEQTQGAVGAVDVTDGGSQVAQGIVEVLDGLGNLCGGQAAGSLVQVVQGMVDVVVVLVQVAGEIV